MTQLTLIIGHEHQKKSKSDCPATHALEEVGEDAFDIQLSHSMGDFRIGRRRYEAAVDSHGEEGDSRSRSTKRVK